MEKTKIAIVGLGTVGTGVDKLLLEQAERIQRHAGREIVLEKVVVRDCNKVRDIVLPSNILTDQLEEVTQNTDIQCKPNPRNLQ